MESRKQQTAETILFSNRQAVQDYLTDLIAVRNSHLGPYYNVIDQLQICLSHGGGTYFDVFVIYHAEKKEGKS